MRQSGFMVNTRNLPPLLSFSALLVCILPHCRLRDWCGNLRKASGHVVCRLDQSASFHIFDSTFYFPHSAIPHFTHSPNCTRYRCATKLVGLGHPKMLGMSIIVGSNNITWFTVNSPHCQFAPVTNLPLLNMGRVGIQCYHPNFWQLSISTRDSTE